MLWWWLVMQVVRGDASVAIGVRGADFVVVAADAAFRRGTVSMSGQVDKIIEVDDRQVLCAVGDAGEADDFCEFVRESLNLYQFRGGGRPTGAQAAHFVRRQLVDARRNERRLPKLHLLLASIDQGASLFWLDETGAATELPFAAHGLGAALVLGHLDRAYSEDMAVDDALSLVDACLAQLHERYAASTASGFVVKVITTTGERRHFKWRPSFEPPLLESALPPSASLSLKP